MDDLEIPHESPALRGAVRQGYAIGMAKALLAFLDIGGVAISDADLEWLEAWVLRAAAATKVRDVQG
jgi:hypothetical protein